MIGKFTKILSLSSVITLFLLSTNSCKPTKYLNEGQLMLKKNKIKGNDKFSLYDLEEFYRQTPNRKFFLLPYRPYLHAYYYGERIYDTLKIEEKFNKKINRLKVKYNQQDEINNFKDSTEYSYFIFKKNELLEKKALILKEGNWLMRSVGEKLWYLILLI